MLRPFARLLIISTLFTTSLPSLAQQDDATTTKLKLTPLVYQLPATTDDVSYGANDSCACAPLSLTGQAANFQNISLKVSPWPTSMQNGNATFYKGTPSYAREHKIKYWAATPKSKNIPKGICLMVTSKKDPSHHVAVVTADVGTFNGVAHCVLDLSINSAKKIDPHYSVTGRMDVTAVPVPMQVCEDQS